MEILPFPNLEAGKDFSIDLLLANDTDHAMEVTFNRKPYNKLLELPSQVTLKARERKTVTLRYHYIRKHKESRYIWLIPSVNGKEIKPLKVRWNGDAKFQLNM